MPPIKCTGQQIETALGCVDVSSTSNFAIWFLRLGIGIGGGIAFLLMIAAVFMIMTSSGDPKKLQAGQELIGSALGGLLMIILSLFLLRLVGIQILQIPGL